jgi:hypothetical protein
MGTGQLARLLVLRQHVAPRHRDDELVSAGGRGANGMAHDRFVERKRRGLLDLPSDQLVEIRRT